MDQCSIESSSKLVSSLLPTALRLYQIKKFLLKIDLCYYYIFIFIIHDKGSKLLCGLIIQHTDFLSTDRTRKINQ